MPALLRSLPESRRGGLQEKGPMRSSRATAPWQLTTLCQMQTHQNTSFRGRCAQLRFTSAPVLCRSSAAGSFLCDQTVANRITNQVGRGAETKLAYHVALMELDRLARDLQQVGHGLCRMSLGNQL